MTRILRVLLALTIGTSLTAGPVSAAAAPVSSQVIAQTTPAATATITGTVKDDSGAPVAGADIFAVGPGNYETHTTAKGTFSIANVKPGLYSIAVTHPGYSSATQEDVAIAPGASEVVNATLVAATTQSLRLIGTVTANAGRRFNTSGLSITTLDNAQLTARVQPNLKDVVSELPGVIASRDANGRSPNSSFQIRGGMVETKVTIDGHAISSGVFGTYNNNYANSEIFEQVEVLKGAGLNGVNAGESAFGTINLRTRNFLAKNGYEFSLSRDAFGSGWLNFMGNYNTGKWSFLAARSYQGFNGPDQYVTNALIGNTLGGTTSPGHGPNSLIQWTGSMANPYSTEADLLKARYKFSQATWLTGEWLNLTGRYYNQGGSYAYYDGVYTIPQCANGGVFVPAGGAGCTVTSTYNPPFMQNLIGTQQPLYNFFPNSQILNNEPQFSMELRTTHKNDTFFLRPYRTQIKRDINGSTENQQIGYGAPGGWYMVTNAANCQVAFAAPTVPAGGAKGPCFTSANNYTAPYIGAPNPAQPVVFVTTPNAPACSVATPCWTTPTNVQRNGYYGYNTPFSQPEIDRLSGTTFTWLHPVGPHLYSFNIDYTRDNTLKFTADNSVLPAGCMPVVTAGLPNLPTTNTGAPNPYYQPACTVNGTVLANLPATALQIPPTTNVKTDYSLTALWQLSPKLQVGLGNYLTVQRMDYVYTDPAAALAAANTKASNGKALSGAEPADATLLHGIANRTHYDPHLQIQYRATPNTSYRLTAGSSITTPWASLLSGFAKISPNTTPTTDVATLPNPNLQPETTVAYNLGFDHRFSDGSVVSADYFNNTIHNVFVTFGQAGPGTRPGITTLITNQTVNGPLERDYGLEFTAQKAPPRGLGYYVTATAQRAYFDGFSDAFYQALAAQSAPGANPFIALVNGKQLDGTSGFQGQVPFFKAKVEGNWRAKNNAYYAVGTNILGSNNPYGFGHGFNTWYGNATWDVGRDLLFSIAGENLSNFNSGSQTGNVVNLGGAQIVGIRWNALTNSFQNGNASFFPASAVVVPPPNLYFTLTKKL